MVTGSWHPSDFRQPLIDLTEILQQFLLMNWELLLSVVILIAGLWGLVKVLYWKWPTVDWLAVLQGDSLRLRVHFAEFREYRPVIYLKYLLLTADRRARLMGSWSIVYIAPILAGIGFWAGSQDLAMGERLLYQNRGEFATAIISLVSAGLVGVVFLLERGDADIYRGSGLKDRFAEIRLFPMIYGIIGLCAVLLYFALILEGTAWIDWLTIIAGGLALLVLVGLFWQIVEELADDSHSGFFSRQLLRSAITQSMRQHRHKLATRILQQQVPNDIEYTDNVVPYVQVIQQESKLHGDELTLDGDHLSDVNLKKFRVAAATLQAEIVDSGDGTNSTTGPQISIGTKTGLTRHSTIIESPEDVENIDQDTIIQQLSAALTARDNRLWNRSAIRYEENLEILKQSTMENASGGHTEQLREDLDEYRNLGQTLLTIEVPEQIDLIETAHDPLCKDYREIFRAALVHSKKHGNQVINSLHVTTSRARKQDTVAYDRYFQTLCDFIDEIHEKPEHADRFHLARQISTESGLPHSSTKTLADLSGEDFRPVSIIVRRSRRTGILLARAGDFKALSKFTNLYTPLYRNLQRCSRYFDSDADDLRDHNLFTADPNTPDFDDELRGAYAELFQDAIDAIRFEMVIAAYTAFQDDAIQTDDWSEILNDSELPTDPAELNQAFDRWHHSMRGGATDIDPGGFAGVARDILTEWNETRGEVATHVFGALLLHHEANRGNQLSIGAELPDQVTFSALYESCEELVRSGEVGNLGEQVTWGTLEEALEPFTGDVNFGSLNLSDGNSTTDHIELLDQFGETFRRRFTLRRWLDRNGQLEYSDSVDQSKLAFCEWILDSDDIQYTSDGIPGLVTGQRLRELQDAVVQGWIEELTQQNAVEERTVTSEEAIYSEVRQQLRQGSGQVALIHSPTGLEFESNEQGLSGLIRPPDSRAQAVDFERESLRVPVFEHNLDHDVVLLFDQQSFTVTEPATPTENLDTALNPTGPHSQDTLVEFKTAYKAVVTADTTSLIAFKINNPNHE